MKFAVVFDNAVREIRDYDELPKCKKVDGVSVIRPFVEKDETATKKHGGFNIFDDRVERKLVAKTAEDLAADADKAASKIEAQSQKLFFKLYKALIAANVLQATDPKVEAIQTAYVEWKALRGE